MNNWYTGGSEDTATRPSTDQDQDPSGEEGLSPSEDSPHIVVMCEAGSAFLDDLESVVPDSGIFLKKKQFPQL